ncbi:hypothetical protein M9H77_30467 [Catharanthus roseus]|uniref:Uncharacterized protein n=1 Tax=Catharanthus roseus TaxID=4058 RepID=A0ACB9ZYD8_CATRO|nr:hypothetical protein M9H77_30467 [Catharanthus roseus]
MKTPFQPRASSDGMDFLDSREWIHLKRGVDRGGCGPIGLRGHLIILCGRVRLPRGDFDYEILELDSDDLVLGSGLCLWSPTVTLHVLLNSGVEAALTEIVLERDPIPLIDMYDSETVEGPVAREVDPGVSIEEDPNEAESDAGMVPQPEEVAPVRTEGIDTLSNEQQLEAASQQIVRLREEISQMDAFCYTARQTHWQATARFLSTMRDTVDRARAELESRPGGSGSRHPQVRIQKRVHTSRKAAIGSVGTSYKRPGQGPWKSGDYKRLHGKQRIGNEGRRTQTPGGVQEYVHIVNIPRTSALRCNKYLRRCPEEQADPRLREEPQKE